jgi:hypothetical protein
MINKLIRLSFTLCLAAFFLYPMADADLGWHLRYGDYFLTHQQVLKTNEFSWTMPNYVWPNHSWGADVVTAWLFKLGSFDLLSLVASILIALSFWLTVRRLSPPAVAVSAVIFIYFGQYLLNVGFRSQLFSLVFTCYLLSRLHSTWTTSRFQLYDLPLLFLIWANLHGQHLLGLGLLWLYTLSLWLKPTSTNPKARFHLTLISLISSLVIFFNPYGFALFKTTIAHVNNPILQNIFEWMPWELNTPRMLVFLTYVLFTTYALYTQKRRLFLGDILILMVSGVLSLKARRIIPFFVLLSLPVTIPFVLSKIRLTSRLSSLAYLFIATISLSVICIFILPSRHVFFQTWNSYCQGEVLCSEPLINFLETNKIQGKILNSYRLGGHLIYRYPELKVFIDGRMTVWEDANQYRPFADYLTMIHNQPGASHLLETYNFDYVIIHPQFELASVLSNTLSWPIIYQDSIVRVYQNPHHP